MYTQYAKSASVPYVPPKQSDANKEAVHAYLNSEILELAKRLRKLVDEDEFLRLQHHAEIDNMEKAKQKDGYFKESDLSLITTKRASVVESVGVVSTCLDSFSRAKDALDESPTKLNELSKMVAKEIAHEFARQAKLIETQSYSHPGSPSSPHSPTSSPTR